MKTAVSMYVCMYASSICLLHSSWRHFEETDPGQHEGQLVSETPEGADYPSISICPTSAYPSIKLHATGMFMKSWQSLS
jgi:hypothetical protein